MPHLGGAQVSALLETVPGIASVLRSPTADALVNMIRAGAGAAEFRVEDALELIQYAVRRGLVGADEGERLTAEVNNMPPLRRGRSAAKATAKSRRRPAAKAAAKRPAAKKTPHKKKR